MNGLRRWYGNEDPKVCFVERKTHRESWKGEESVKERFTLPESKMVPFLEGEYTLDKAQADLRAKVGGVSEPGDLAWPCSTTCCGKCAHYWLNDPHSVHEGVCRTQHVPGLHGGHTWGRAS